MASLFSIVSTFVEQYSKNTIRRLKLIDVYLTYIVLTGIVQFVYCMMVGTFPKNSFLSGFISCVGSFCLAVALRMQVNPSNKFERNLNISPERAFADFIGASLLFHFVVLSFIG
mmetsp:Transcript_10983/g.12059  ORF Transcript_10983/g.12059 Transcript_10983/m.12059 type:complete len:114 (-) Transcript_10983:85-426(-)